jgi:hypothetical protein
MTKHYLLAINIALVSIALAPARAQDQKTLGPCSPAIASVQGNVSVTCITGDRRIRIAKYSGDIDPDKGVALASFLEANCGHIVHLYAAANGLSKRQRYAADRDFAYFALERRSTAAHCSPLDEKNGGDCYSMEVDFTDEKNAVQTAVWIHGMWVYEGYYLVHCGSIYTGSLAVTLRQIDDKEILLSDKYDTK